MGHSCELRAELVYNAGVQPTTGDAHADRRQLAVTHRRQQHERELTLKPPPFQTNLQEIKTPQVVNL